METGNLTSNYDTALGFLKKTINLLTKLNLNNFFSIYLYKDQKQYIQICQN